MNVPFGEWTLADVWQAIYTQPRLLCRSKDRRFPRSDYVLHIDNEKVVVSFSGHHLEGIDDARLWFPDSPHPISVVDDNGPYWTNWALRHSDRVNEVCWPYSLVVNHGFWCIENAKTKDVKVYKHATRFKDLPPITESVIEMVSSFDQMVREYVQAIDPSQLPQTTLCESCMAGDGGHLVQHIARCEADGWMLKSLIGYQAGSPWTSLQQEHLIHVLKYLTVNGLGKHQVKIAIPNSVLDSVYGISWSPAPDLTLGKLE